MNNNLNNNKNLVIFTAKFPPKYRLEVNPNLEIEYLKGVYTIDNLYRITSIGILKPAGKEETVLVNYGQAVHPDFSKLTMENLLAAFKLEVDSMLYNKAQHIGNVSVKFLFEHKKLNDSTYLFVVGHIDSSFECHYTIKTESSIDRFNLNVKTGTLNV